VIARRRAGVVRVRAGVQDSELEQQTGHVLQRRIERQAARLHLVRDGHQLRALARGDRAKQAQQVRVVHCPQHVAHAFRGDAAGAVGDRLVQ